MFAGQFEGRKGMVKRGGSPTSRGVTVPAQCRESTLVLVLFGMTGVTIRRCARVIAVDVTRLAAGLGMFAFQFEGGKVVVKDGRRPAGSGVTCGAVVSQAALMGVSVYVAGKAINGSGAQVRDGAGVKVASGAGRAHVHPGQGEGEVIVIEAVSISVQTVVADQAVIPEREQVGDRKGSVELVVAGLADGWVEGSEVRAVAVGTGERRAVGQDGMTG